MSTVRRIHRRQLMAAILEIDLDGKPERELKELIEGNDEAEEILA